jgi:hypothetical protein
MKKKIAILTLALGLTTASYAQFGGMMGGGGGGAGGDVGAQVEAFNKDALIIREAMANALTQLTYAFGDQKSIAAAKTQAENLAKTTDTKEIGNIQGSIIKDQEAAMAEALSGDAAKAKMAKLAPEMQKKIAQSIFNVAISALKIPESIKKGQGIIQSVGSNPMQLPKVLPVKDGISMFADALPNLPKIVTAGLQLVKGAGITPENATATSTVVQIKPELPPE